MTSRIYMFIVWTSELTSLYSLCKLAEKIYLLTFWNCEGSIQLKIGKANLFFVRWIILKV